MTCGLTRLILEPEPGRDWRPPVHDGHILSACVDFTSSKEAMEARDRYLLLSIKFTLHQL